MIETGSKEIGSGKILIKSVFGSDMWYRIPDYQRPYVWGNDQINTLLDDIAYAAENTPESQYFLGSIVLHSKSVEKGGIRYQEHDVLDGQQRLTTLYLMLAVIRDLTEVSALIRTCTESIFQEANPYDNIPERLRIVFDIREDVKDFVNNYIKPLGGTNDLEKIKHIKSKSEDVSVRNMANAIIRIRDWFELYGLEKLNKIIPYLRNYVLLIYVASKELEDAFRMFTVLNDRGVKLRNSDILKAENLKFASEEKRKEYASLWEELEGELGEEFDQFLSYIRTILVKEKARLSLLKEFEQNIYAVSDNTAISRVIKEKVPLLKKGDQTFEFVKKYKEHFDVLFSGNNYDINKSWEFDNLITVLREAALSDIWIPPLLFYRENFGDYRILEMLKLLDNKFSGDWIAGETPTKRIDAMNSILKEIERYAMSASSKREGADELLESVVFDFDKTDFVNQLNYNSVYGRRFARYILFKLDFLFGSNDQKRDAPSQISVEHILPQNPLNGSEWTQIYTEEERKELAHKIGNLVLISRRKNTSQGRLPFAEKKEKYFRKNIETFPNSLRLLNHYEKWGPEELTHNHKVIIKNLMDYYRISDVF